MPNAEEDTTVTLLTHNTEPGSAKVGTHGKLLSESVPIILQINSYSTCSPCMHLIKVITHVISMPCMHARMSIYYKIIYYDIYVCVLYIHLYHACIYIHMYKEYEECDLLVADISISPEETEKILLDVCLPLSSRKDKMFRRNMQVIDDYNTTYVDERLTSACTYYVIYTVYTACICIYSLSFQEYIIQASNTIHSSNYYNAAYYCHSLFNM